MNNYEKIALQAVLEIADDTHNAEAILRCINRYGAEKIVKEFNGIDMDKSLYPLPLVRKMQEISKGFSLEG